MFRTRIAPIAFLLSLLIGCTGESSGPRLIVIGVDGAEWSAIRKLWDQDRLPHLRQLAERGASGSLATDYASSPVIWTTMATGR